jgi:hypothetical protein
MVAITRRPDFLYFSPIFEKKIMFRPLDDLMSF